MQTAFPDIGESATRVPAKSSKKATSAKRMSHETSLIVAGALISIAINPLIFRLVRTLDQRTRVPAAEGRVASAQT
jgi:hypothetical protein